MVLCQPCFLIYLVFPHTITFSRISPSLFGEILGLPLKFASPVILVWRASHGLHFLLLAWPLPGVWHADLSLWHSPFPALLKKMIQFHRPAVNTHCVVFGSQKNFISWESSLKRFSLLSLSVTMIHIKFNLLFIIMENSL